MNSEDVSNLQRRLFSAHARRRLRKLPKTTSLLLLASKIAVKTQGCSCKLGCESRCGCNRQKVRCSPLCKCIGCEIGLDLKEIEEGLTAIAEEGSWTPSARKEGFLEFDNW